MLTIHELMVSLSDLLPADRLTLIAHLYDAWTEVMGMGESFDDFYYWGRSCWPTLTISTSIWYLQKTSSGTWRD